MRSGRLRSRHPTLADRFVPCHCTDHLRSGLPDHRRQGLACRSRALPHPHASAVLVDPRRGLTGLRDSATPCRAISAATGCVARSAPPLLLATGTSKNADGILGFEALEFQRIDREKMPCVACKQDEVMFQRRGSYQCIRQLQTVG